MDVGVFLTELIDAKAATAGAIADLELRKKEKLEKLLAYEDKVASVEHAKVQFEHVPTDYYDCLPLKPGVGAWEWLAKHVQTGKPLDLHIPDTVVLVDGHPTWLRSTKTTTLIPSPYTHRVVTVPTSQSRWKRQFKRETCPHFSSPLSSLTREQLLAPVAVIRSHSHHQCSHASVVLQAVYDVMVKEHVAGSRPECVQAFVRNKGLKPCVYRVVWKRGKSSHALVMTSRHLFDKYESGTPPVWTHSQDSLTGVEVPVEVSADDSEWINARVTLDSHAKGSFDVVKVSGVAVRVPVDMLQRLVEYIESSMATQYQWKFESAVGDFIKDDHDQWWFLQLKSFEVTESCHRICRIVSEAVQAAEENSTPYEFRITLRALGLNVDGLTNAELQRYLDAGRALYSAEVLEVTGQPRQSRPQSAPMHHESKQASQEILGRSCYLCGCVYSAHDTVESELKNAEEEVDEAPVGEKREMMRLMDEARFAAMPDTDQGNLSQTFQSASRLHLRRNSQEEIDIKIGQLTQQDYHSDSSGEFEGTGFPDSPTKRRMQRVRHKMHARSKEHLRNSKPKPKSAKEAAKDSAIALVERLGAFGGDIPKSDRIVPMLGYQMTIAMMQELVSYMKRQGRLPSCFSGFDASHTGGRCETVLRYSHRDVCRLCYDLYKRVSQMHVVSESLARTLATPLPSQLPSDEYVPLRNMSTLRSKDAKDVLDMFPTSEKVLPTGATPGRKLGREGRRNSDVIKMPRKVDANDHGMLCRVPTSELDPTAQQYRLMVVVRHVEDIAWTPEESKTEEGLENFDPAENYQRTCEIRYTLLNVEHKIQFTFTREDVIANVQAVRLHYVVATDDALQRWLSNDALSLDLFDVKGKDIDPNMCVGRSNLQFDRFCSGRKVTQEKQDMVLPMVTAEYGMVGLAVSIGIVCDGRALLSDAVPALYTRGSGIFWPPESYHDFHALPDVWMGSLSALRSKQSAKKAAPSKREALESSVTRQPFSLQSVDAAKRRVLEGEVPVQSPGGKSMASAGTNYSNDGFDSEENAGPTAPSLKRVGSKLATTVDLSPEIVNGVVDGVLVDDDCESVASGGSFSSIDSLDDIIDRYMFPVLPDEEVWEKKLKSTFMNLAGLDGCGTVPAKDIVSTMYEEFQAEVEAERVLAGKRSVLGLFIKSDGSSPHPADGVVGSPPPKEPTPVTTSEGIQPPPFQSDVSYSPIPVEGEGGGHMVIATDHLDETLLPPQPSPAPTPLETPFQRFSNPNAVAKWKFIARKVREGCFRPGGLARRDHLPGWIHAKNVIEAILGDSFNLALSEASSSQSLNVPASAITWRQLLCGIELYNSIRGSTAVMAPGHDSVLGSVLTPGHRDSFQRRAWREAVLEKLFQAVEGENGSVHQSQRDPASRRVDIGELKAQLEWQANLDDDSAATIICRWMLADSDVQSMFQHYNENASGTVSLLQLCDLAHSAYQWVTAPGHRLAMSEGGVCRHHGDVEAFSADKYCVRCEKKHVAKEIRTGVRALRPSELVHSNGKPHHRMFRMKSLRPPRDSGLDWSARTDNSLSHSTMSLNTGGSLYKDALMGMLVGGKFKSATAGCEAKRLHASDFLSKSTGTRKKPGKGLSRSAPKRVGWKGHEQPSFQSSVRTLQAEGPVEVEVVPSKPRTPTPDIDVADLLEGYESSENGREIASPQARVAVNPREASPVQLAPMKVTSSDQTAAAFRLAAGRSARPSSAMSRRPASASVRLPTARSAMQTGPTLTIQPAYLHVGGDVVAMTPKGIDKAIDAAVNKAIELEENRARERMRKDPSVSQFVANHRAMTALKEWQDPTAEGNDKQLHEYWASDTPAEQRQAWLNRRGKAPVVTAALTEAREGGERSVAGSDRAYETWAGGSTTASSMGTVEEQYHSDVPVQPEHHRPPSHSGLEVSRSGVTSMLHTNAEPNYQLLQSMGIDIAPKPKILGDIPFKVPIETSFQWTALDAARAARHPRSSATSQDVWAQRNNSAAVRPQRYNKVPKKSVVEPYWRPKALESSKSAPKVGWVVKEATMRRASTVAAKVNSIGDVVGGVKLQPIDVLLARPRPMG